MATNSTNLYSKTFDLIFIGSGIGTSFTLMPLLEELKKMNDRTFNIAIIERSDEFHTGVAYGNRTGDTALLITSLSDFLPEGEYRNDFINWLNKHKEELISNLKSHDGARTQNWLNTHEAEIANNQWHDIYIPRRFFGVYVKQKVQYAIETSTNVEITLINTEVEALYPNNQGFSIQCFDKTIIKAKRVVLSVGIPPIKKLWLSKEYKELAKYACLIENPYQPSLFANLNKIESFVSQLKEPANILIIGSNASAMEMIYKLHDEPGISKQLSKFIVISPQGELPNSAQNDFTKSISFTPRHLQSLQLKNGITADEINTAANLDLDEAEDMGYGTAITEIPVSQDFTSLLQKLSDSELTKFACLYGNEIGKRQRRAGQHYTDVVDGLIKTNKLENIKGYFVAFKVSPSKNGLNFTYTSKGSDKLQKSIENVHVVLSCIGGKLLTQQPLSPLLDQLINDGICKINDSYRGFLVNKDLEATNKLHVAGPLLAGNVVNSNALWHLEHCGRIISLGKTLSQKLLQFI